MIYDKGGVNCFTVHRILAGLMLTTPAVSHVRSSVGQVGDLLGPFQQSALEKRDASYRTRAALMAPGNAPSRQLLQCLRSLSIGPQSEFVSQCTRSLTTSAAHFDELDILSTSYYRQPDPANVFVRRLERRLTRAGTPPIGSRRRRVLQHEAPGIPFEQLPFQCFQEARKVLQADREEKLKKIEVERARIARLRDADPELSGGEFRKQNRLKSMHATLEKLKILADINDPMVKKRFEDELGMFRETGSCTC